MIHPNIKRMLTHKCDTTGTVIHLSMYKKLYVVNAMDNRLYTRRFPNTEAGFAQAKTYYDMLCDILEADDQARAGDIYHLV